MLSGWIKLHRRTLEHWIAQEPELLAVWVRMLLEANHAETKRLFNGSLITINRGQFIFGLEAFSAKTKVSISKLRRCLKLLEDDSMIDRQKTNKYSLISIVNYDSYQLDGSQEDSQNATIQQSDDNQTTTSPQHRKNVKNVKNEEDNKGDKSSKKKTYKDLDYSSWPELPGEQYLADWNKHRGNKKPITQTVVNTIGAQLKKANELGYTCQQCFEEWGAAWNSFKAEWMVNAKVMPAKQTRQITHASDLPFPAS